MQQMKDGVDKPRPKVLFRWARWSASRKVRSDFNGSVEDVNYEKARSACRDHLRSRDAGRTDFSQVENLIFVGCPEAPRLCARQGKRSATIFAVR